VKGDQLYGLSITKDHIRKSGIAVVVEGEFDLISSYQAGVTNVVAIKGSALTEAQIRLIKRFAERLVLALDKDVAGDAASRRGIELADQAGLEIRVVDIPSGKDPDEAARETTTRLPLLTSAIARFGTSEAFAKKKVSDEVLPQLSKIVNPIVQAHYVKLLATKLEINEEKVSEALKNIKPQLGFTKKTLAVAPTPRTHTELIEEMILALVIQAADPPAALNLVSEQIDPSDLTDGVIRRIFMSLIDYLSAHEKLDVNELARGLSPELMPTLDRVYLIDLAQAGAGKYWEQEIRRTTSLLKQDSLRRKISGLATEVTAAEKRSDEASLKELNTQLNTATTALKRLS
ncbi:MAG: primase protein, partial [Candidatus Roizmanbacteria bacterium GW2011_GWC2_41_7]